MTNKDSDIILDENKETTEDAAVSKKQMRAEKAEQQLQETLKKIQETAQDSDTHPGQQLSMKSVLGGDFLTADFVRAQVGLAEKATPNPRAAAKVMALTPSITLFETRTA